MYAITSGEGMVKVTGEVGAGKTMLCRVLMERLPAEVDTILPRQPLAIRATEVLYAVAEELGQPGLQRSDRVTGRLLRDLQGRTPASNSTRKRPAAWW